MCLLVCAPVFLYACCVISKKIWMFENHAKLNSCASILLHGTLAIDFLDFISQKPRQTMLSNDGKTPKIIIAPYLSVWATNFIAGSWFSSPAMQLPFWGVSRFSSFASPAPVKHWSQFMQHISTHQHASCGAISSDSNIWDPGSSCKHGFCWHFQALIFRFIV